MNEGVERQEIASPEDGSQTSNKEFNFRRLEALRDNEREARIRAEMQAENLKSEIQQIKNMLTPQEKDPLDEAEDDDYVDASVLRSRLAKERTAFERRAEEIAGRIYEQRKAEDEKKSYLSRLRNELRDFDDVVNEQSVTALERDDPVFARAVLQVPDDYERRKLAYDYIKSRPKHSIKEKVEENARNPFYIPPSSGNPSAVEFDIRSKEAREQAYARLKAAQKRPLQGGHTQHH